MRVYLPSTLPALADLLAKGEAGPMCAAMGSDRSMMAALMRGGLLAAYFST